MAKLKRVRILGKANIEFETFVWIEEDGTLKDVIDDARNRINEQRDNLHIHDDWDVTDLDAETVSECEFDEEDVELYLNTFSSEEDE